jgi:N-acetylmuramoyl-L-alanine amidase
MDIVQRHLKHGPHTRSGKTLPIITGIVVHWLGNAGTTAQENINYFNTMRHNGPRYGSYHYIIDEDGTINQLMPVEEVAYHAGPSGDTKPETIKQLGGLPNWRTIGVSFAHPDDSGKPTMQTYFSLVRLITQLSIRHSIMPENIIRHYDCTGKACPRYYVDNANMWSALLSQIRMAINGARD